MEKDRDLSGWFHVFVLVIWVVIGATMLWEHHNIKKTTYVVVVRYETPLPDSREATGTYTMTLFGDSKMDVVKQINKKMLKLVGSNSLWETTTLHKVWK